MLDAQAVRGARDLVPEKPKNDTRHPPHRAVVAGADGGGGGQSRGFTLLETFVALVILAFALAGLSMLMLGNMQTGLEARRATAGGALAQHKLEELRAAGYSAAVSGTNAPLSETGDTTGVTPFTRTWTVTTGTGTAAGTKTLSVIVSWIDQLGASHQVQLQSILAE